MATEGKITMDQLPFVLVGAEVQATAKEIDEAIEEYIPDSDETEALLDFEQVLCLYQQLAHNSADMAPMNNPQDGGQAKVSLWRRLLLWYKQYRLKQTAKEQRTAYERHMKPTTRLLLMILACASFMCIAVVVLAIAYIWVDASNVMTAHLQRTAQLLSDGMYLFGYTLPFNNYDSNLQQEAMLLGVVAQQLGYMDTMNILKQTMVYEQNLLISFLDSWFSQDSMNTVATNAMISAGFLANLYQRQGLTSAVAMVDRINPLLPAGQEILVGRWDPVAQNITLLCTPRYADQCVDGKCIIANTAMVNAVTGLTGQMFTTDYRPHPVVAGYTYLNASDLGVVFKVDVEVFQADFQEPMATIIDQINAKRAPLHGTGGTNRL